MSGKRRVYEVAREVEMDNKAFLAMLKSLGVPDVKNHMSVLTFEDEARVRQHLGRGGGASTQSESKDVESSPVVQRRGVVRRRKSSDSSSEDVGSPEVPSAPAASAEPLVTSHADSPAESDDRPAAEEDDGAPPIASPPAFSQHSAPAHGSSAQGGASAQTASEPSVPAPSADDKEPESETTQSSSEEHAEFEADSTTEVFESDAKGDESFDADDVPEVSSASATDPESAPASDEELTVPSPVAARPAAPSPSGHAAQGASVSGVPSAASTAAVRGSSPPGPSPSVLPPSPSVPPKRGIDVWEGRPGVPMHNHRPGPRRVQYDAKAPAAATTRRGPGGRMVRGGPRQRGIGSFSKGRGGAPVTKERNAHKKVVRIEETVTLQSLAGSMGVKTGDMLRKLFQLGMSGININSTLDADTAKIIASEFGWEVEDVAVSEAEQLQKAQGMETSEDAPEDLKPCPPVVTVMGHVDHGKTSLLDAMRQTNVVKDESGGITQHIGAYSVDTPHGKVTFMDTPGHAAFTAMRARGVKATDLVVLVVAADDGVMPQTKEAIQHARAAEVPILVAINKCDKPEAQPERVRRELSEQGLVPEEWGGDTLFCEVSAHTKAGIPDLLEKLALQAEVLELRANPDKPASGIVVESQLDRGRGPVATILVKEGTLNRGDVVLAGAAYGKVRAMHDWAGRTLKKVGPAEPVAIIGLSEVPRAGDQVYVVKDLKTAQGIAETRKVKERRSLAPSVGNKPRTLEEIAQLMSETEQLELKVIVKGDVGGSAEAVSESLVQLSTEKVRVSVVLSAAGAITENDVNLAVAAGAIIVGFNVKPAGKAAALAQREGIEIRQYSIIYNVLDDVKLAMEGMLAPKLVEKELGTAEVRQTFRISKTGTIAGSMVTKGLVRRGAGARLIRDGETIWEGKISGLKRFKEDVKEVKDGFECGISLEHHNEIHVGDIIEAFEMESIKQSL